MLKSIKYKCYKCGKEVLQTKKNHLGNIARCNCGNSNLEFISYVGGKDETNSRSSRQNNHSKRQVQR